MDNDFENKEVSSFIRHTLELINKDYKEDIKIDVKDILQLPIIIEKYLEAHFGLLLRINKKEILKNSIYANRFSYYKEGYKVILSPAEIKIYLDGDIELNKVKEDLAFLETLFKQITEIIAELRSLQYILKTKLEYEKLISGA